MVAMSEVCPAKRNKAETLFLYCKGILFLIMPQLVQIFAVYVDWNCVHVNLKSVKLIILEI